MTYNHFIEENNFKFLFFGLIIGFIIAFVIGFVILKKHKFEPGKIVDHYPIRDAINPTTILLLVVNIFLVIAFDHPTLSTQLISGISVALVLFYVLYSILMERSALLIALLEVGVFVIACTPLFYGYTLRLTLLIMGMLCIGLGHSYRLRIYTKNYESWVGNKAKKLYHRYQQYFTDYDKDVQPVLLTIMLVEDIARPSVVRMAERIYARNSRSLANSTGIMQIKHPKILSDVESVKKGFKLINRYYKCGCALNLNGDQFLEYIAYEYNGDVQYSLFMKYFYRQCQSTVETQST